MSAADVSSDVAAIAPLLRLVHQWHHPDRELPPGRDCDACVAVIALDRLAARAAGRDDTIKAAWDLRHDMGVDDIDSRLSYVNVQVTRSTLERFDAALDLDEAGEGV